MKRQIILKLSLFSSINLVGQTELRQKHYNLSNTIAINGYDPVSYFQGDKPLKGYKSFSFNHEGVKYLFVTDKNKQEFIKTPAKYEPQYGGWCAYAMGSSGEKVEVDPETFKIINGKLYLFYNAYFNNTLKDWNKNETKLKSAADMNWLNHYK